MPDIFQSGFAFGLSELFTLAFLGFAGITAVMTLVFYYHWGRYTPGWFMSVLAILVYTIGAATLLLGMFGALAGM